MGSALNSLPSPSLQLQSDKEIWPDQKKDNDKDKDKDKDKDYDNDNDKDKYI